MLPNPLGGAVESQRFSDLAKRGYLQHQENYIFAQ